MKTEKQREHRRLWMKNNPEKCKAASKRYNEKHKEEIKIRNRRRYTPDEEFIPED